MMSDKPQNPEISVSDLLLYINCPRKMYFVSRGFELFPEVNVSRLERMLLKELSLTFLKL
jgi:CRISPR-associated exonuclease Cas4